MTENKVAILQSNYIPWKGVFDMINMVDTFVFFEDVDFTKFSAFMGGKFGIKVF